MIELPLWWATAITVVLLVCLSGFVWLMPGIKVYAKDEDSVIWKDLRLWASLLILIQLGIYYLFG